MYRSQHTRPEQTHSILYINNILCVVYQVPVSAKPTTVAECVVSSSIRSIRVCIIAQVFINNCSIVSRGVSHHNVCVLHLVVLPTPSTSSTQQPVSVRAVSSILARYKFFLRSQNYAADNRSYVVTDTMDPKSHCCAVSASYITGTARAPRPPPPRLVRGGAPEVPPEGPDGGASCRRHVFTRFAFSS